MNGTAENIGDNGSLVGCSRYPDKGNSKYDPNMTNNFIGTGLTALDVIKRVNSSNKYIIKHNYDRSIRIKASGFEDKLAYNAALKQVKSGIYTVCGSSCIDVPQAALGAVLKNRLNIESGRNINSLKNSLNTFEEFKYGFKSLSPNAWFEKLLTTTAQGGGFINIMNNNLSNDFAFKEISANSRYH